MSRGLMRLLLIFSVMASGHLRAEAGPLPLVLSDTAGEWKLARVHRAIAPGINFEMVVSHPRTKERLVVLSSDSPNDTSESLSVFARELQAAFTSPPADEELDREAEQMGYTGCTTQFEVVNEEVLMVGRLFVFTFTGRPWAVLHLRAKATDPMVPNAFDLLRKPGPADGILRLEPYKVKGIPLTSFPISCEIFRDHATNRIREIVVCEVPPGSETERAGVKVGDWVTRINGRAIAEFTGGVDSRTELGRIFLARPFGEKLALELVAAATEQPYAVTLKSRGRTLIDGIHAN